MTYAGASTSFSYDGGNVVFDRFWLQCEGQGARPTTLYPKRFTHNALPTTLYPSIDEVLEEKERAGRRSDEDT